MPPPLGHDNLFYSLGGLVGLLFVRKSMRRLQTGFNWRTSAPWRRKRSLGGHISNAKPVGCRFAIAVSVSVRCSIKRARILLVSPINTHSMAFERP